MFNQILEVAIVEDDYTLAFFPKEGLLSSYKSSAISEAVLDEEEEDEDETVGKFSLKIVVDDLKKSLIEYVFFYDDKPLPKDSDEYEKAINECKDWYT